MHLWGNDFSASAHFDIRADCPYINCMPVLPIPDYRPPFPFRSGNAATLYPPLFRPTPKLLPGRERIETPDKDFLDIDRHKCGTTTSRKLVVVSHGLEGNSRKKYVLGMARMALDFGYDAVCWNQRGCGTSTNRLLRSYHSGETEDLHTVITHCLKSGYEEVALIGFSMGGNQILKYLGENPDRVPAQVKKAITFSVPCDLSESEILISKPSRRVYFEYFMRGLRKKVRTKETMFPDKVDSFHLEGITSLRQFDDIYTAPHNGFANAEEYYAKSSCKQFLPNISVPTLLVQALNDPFLAPACFPVTEADNNANLMLEIPQYGGHVGFVQAGPENIYWSEARAKAFLAE